MRLVGREEKDGTYLLRPFGDLPFVYHADKLVTGRLIKFYRKANSWVFWGALLSGALMLPVLLNFWSDDLFLATVIFAIGTFAVESVGVVAGVLFILRHASRVPPATFPTPKPKAEPVRWRLLRATATIAAWLSLAGLFIAPDYLPFFPWEWIATGLVAFALVTFVADHLRRQREQSGKPPPTKIDDRAVQRRRILWGTLLGPLANPLALWFAARLLFSDEFEVTDNTPRIFELLLGPSYGFGLALALCLLLGLGRTGMRWYLGAATIATLLIAPLWFYFFEPYFSPELRMGSEVLYVSLTTSAFIAYPMVIAFWLIARPDRYADSPDANAAAA
jgi:peptidoglycan/LPS O-acetylase OafA/YrhL